MIIFDDYCENVMKMVPTYNHYDKMVSSKHHRKAWDRYEDYIKEDKTRNIAVFYGGRPLKGTYKQNKWAEDIRQKFLENKLITEEEIKEIVKTEGNADNSKFWIENRNASVDEIKKLILGE